MTLQFSTILLVLFTFASWTAAQSMNASSLSLPIVDLGYELHRASYYNETGNFYNFSNVRFAQALVGHLRISPPQAPIVDRAIVQTGSQPRVCLQALPNWYGQQGTAMFEYLYGINDSWTSLTGDYDPNESEDCLFLDIVVPKPVFNGADQGRQAPVLVWIYGGGFTTGSKSGSASGPVDGLLRRGNNNFVFVDINYRLGAFGWLSGPTFQEDGTANLGLLDQRFALEWVQKYIHLFGGDPDNVTVMGESSGGGSVLHQITAYGGKGNAPFHRAILQSPGSTSVLSNSQQEATFQTFLSLLNVSTLSEARALPSSVLIAANAAQITSNNVIGNTVYGPVVDGSFVPSLPGLLLLHDAFYQSVSVMVGYNQNDGLLFTNLTVPDDNAYRSIITSHLGTVQPQALDYIANTLYPPIFSGAYGYTSQIGRAITTMQDLIIQCDTLFLTSAMGNKTYNYGFAVPPALHGMDVAYSFYDDGAAGPEDAVESAEVAVAMQDYFTSFVENGVPEAEGMSTWPMYESQGNLMVYNISGVSLGMEGGLEWERCAWWQKGLWY